MRRRALLSVGKGESPYACSLHIQVASNTLNIGPEYPYYEEFVKVFDTIARYAVDNDIEEVVCPPEIDFRINGVWINGWYSYGWDDWGTEGIFWDAYMYSNFNEYITPLWSGFIQVSDKGVLTGSFTFDHLLRKTDANSGSLYNLAIANYFLNNYPNMVINNGGKYTPTAEDVYITGTNNCDGYSIGVAKFTNSTEHVSLLFYTNQSIRNLYALRVFVKDDVVPPGTTTEFFYD